MAVALAKLVRSKPFLFDKAWPTVRRSGLRSRSVDTQDGVRAFQTHAEQSLKKIQRQLREQRFKFGPARGVPIPKNSGGYRPLVVPQIPSRIVQRSILEVLLTQPPIRSVVNQRTSYGTSRTHQVRHAIRDVCLAIEAGAAYYIRSDIMEFFTHIPRLQVLQQLRNLLPDNSLDELLKAATWFELEQVPPRLSGLFPSYDEGVAQGCCLSPLFGNLLLGEFDQLMNSTRVHTLRYVDDFIILGPDKGSVNSAFTTAQGILRRFRMKAYDPNVNPGKASCGSTARKFEFLGCSISRGFIQPSKKARSSFLSRIEKKLKDEGRHLARGAFGHGAGYDHSLLATLIRVSRMIEAWTNHYDFCNTQQTFEQFDREVDQLIASYIGKYADKRKRLDVDSRRRLLGVWLAQDGKRSPISYGK